jgi:hypothetical protein
VIGRIVLAIAIGVLVWILCVIVGDAVAHTDIPIVKTIGADIRDFAVILGVVAAVLAYFSGFNPFGNIGTKA